MDFISVYDVAVNRLCTGCGACHYGCPEKRVRLIDIEDDGIRPIVTSGGCDNCDRCITICPGLNTNTNISELRSTAEKSIESLAKQWGHVLEVWEGYASDPEIRYRGSSGGLCTALSIFCLEKKNVGGVVLIGQVDETPWTNKTYFSRTRSELVSKTGSRYAPASPCDSLRKIETSDKPCVFIGKPCDVTGLRMAQNSNPELGDKTFLAIGFFCAGTPSTRGTLDLLRKHHINPEEISNFRYRGMGWPGKAVAWRKNGKEPFMQVSYRDSWGFVQKYRPFRCYLCPDLTAEFADISVGDPWYREVDENEPGQSLILIRTEKGRKIFQEAIESGYVEAVRVEPDILYKSQKNLLGKRQAIWGRLLAMKMLGIPYPKLEGFHLYENWLDLPLKEKVKSVLGTVRRIVQRNYFRPLDYSKYQNR